MDARALRDLRELERQDLELSLESSALEAVLAAVEHVRARAEEIDTFFAGYPERAAEARREIAGAERELAARRAALADAERAVADTDDERQRELAEHAAARAADHVAVAHRSLERAHATQSTLERDASRLPGELERLEVEARRLTPVARGAHEPEPGPRRLVAWASHARAELFVALSQLAIRGERVIREANELATSLLGEPTFGSTVAQALRRVEAR